MTTDSTLPPGPRAADPDDWWDRLYDTDEPTRPDRAPRWWEQPPTPGVPRLPDWRTGQAITLERHTDPEDDEPNPDTDDVDLLEDQDEGDDEGDDVENSATPARLRRRARPRAYYGRPTPQFHLTLDYRTRVVLYNSAAYATGALFGLPQLIGHWIAATGLAHSSNGALALGIGICVVAGVFDWRTRCYWPPLAWVCRIPLASAAVALTCYAPNSL